MTDLGRLSYRQAVAEDGGRAGQHVLGLPLRPDHDLPGQHDDPDGQQLGPGAAPDAAAEIGYARDQKNAQPIAVDSTHGSVAIAHNGNLTNAEGVRQRPAGDVVEEVAAPGAPPAKLVVLQRALVQRESA